MRASLLFGLTALLAAGASGLEARWDRGSLVSLTDAAGRRLVTPGGLARPLTIRRLAGGHPVSGDAGLSEPGQWSFGEFADLPGASATARCELADGGRQLLVQHQAQSPNDGVWGVEWSIGSIPLDYNIIVPGRSGLRFTRDGAGPEGFFDYPYSWEAQFVIVEGNGHGFLVYADDPTMRFKRLEVLRDREGWALRLTTMNQAPFEPQREVASVPWRVTAYEGDWRVAARVYRDWMRRCHQPVALADQQPGWVKDMRCCLVYYGWDLARLAELARHVDPAQTFLYVPNWRSQGYDKGYPDYDQVVDELGPWLAEARRLGFRVMLHVNYFGVDEQHALYETFAPFQCRSPFTGERLWWIPPRDRKRPDQPPSLKFAYINPALKAWRELFVERMVKLCQEYPIDALHLDQTLCIYNDQNGLIDGMTMAEGNLALHRELREALPQVALSGEGLNEVTYRYEAFAQRHAYGLSHSEGTWDRAKLALAHPICSFLFRDYTIINGYLGYTGPDNGPLFAAWNEAYEHWGVIPTLKWTGQPLAEMKDFGRQLMDEVKLFTEHLVDPAMDDDWPEDVAFPFRTASGERVIRTRDSKLLHGDRLVTWTISGVSETELPGSLDNWHAFAGQRAFGLDPALWYAHQPEPFDPSRPHLTSIPPGLIVEGLVVGPNLTVVRTRALEATVADLVANLSEATGGTRPFGGPEQTFEGGFQAEDGGSFRASGGMLAAHPPWRASFRHPETGVTHAGGTGEAFVRYQLALPDTAGLQFVSDVLLDAGAVGPERSDGVTFRVVARAEGQERTAELHQATAEPQPLVVDLTPWRGREVELELVVHPGPARQATFDWARWLRPRVEVEAAGRGIFEFASIGDQWRLALAGAESSPVRQVGDRLQTEASFPGKLYLLPDEPPLVGLPFDLTRASFATTFLSDVGLVLERPAHAAARGAQRDTVDGVTRSALGMHPPNQGRTIADFALGLPPSPAVFRSWIGLRDGSRSAGVQFLVEVNGQTVVDETILPGQWHPVEADLAPWAGRAVILSMITDSAGTYEYDWATWGEPSLLLR